MERHCDSHGHAHMYEGSLYSEFLCHFPYAIIAVTCSMALIACMTYIAIINEAMDMHVEDASNIMFHTFHFMHIIFAATGSIITYCRFAPFSIYAIIINGLSAVFFCSLSDVIIPYVGGMLMGMELDLHFCFLEELSNVVPFLCVGILNGFIMSKHHSSKQLGFSLYSHFIHILISAFASLFYLTSQGVAHWYHNMGMVFVFLLIAVVVPCTLSDLVVPFFVAKNKSS
ncbi:MAG: hypothetical protein WBQ73_03615 [Candidatus Babeliales bacterium]